MSRPLYLIVVFYLSSYVPPSGHPGTHQQPAFETVEALLAPLDKLKVLFATWRTKEEKKA